MSDAKISELAAVTDIDLDDLFVVVEDGTTKKATLNDIVKFGNWTPAIVDDGAALNYGSGAVRSGRYAKIGKLVQLWGTVKFGTTSFAQGTGNYRITDFPFDYGASVLAGTGLDIGAYVIGTVMVWDDSASLHRVGAAARWGTETEGVVALVEEDGATNNFLGANQPWAWGQGDQINFQLAYETDS